VIHEHLIALNFAEGVTPSTVVLRHSHSEKPEEPHGHTIRVTLRAGKVMTEKSA
jgi:hypothetical protein